MSTEHDPRYPYTHASDYLRMYGGIDRSGVRLSRADASSIRSAVAVAIGMDDEELARKLADYYKANEDRLIDEHAEQLLRGLGMKS